MGPLESGGGGTSGGRRGSRFGSLRRLAGCCSHDPRNGWRSRVRREGEREREESEGGLIGVSDLIHDNERG